MKKKLFAMFLMALLFFTLTTTAFAETIPGQSGWYVEFNNKQKMVSNFSSGDIADALSNVQPGDETTVTVTVRNCSCGRPDPLSTVQAGLHEIAAVGSTTTLPPAP